MHLRCGCSGTTTLPFSLLGLDSIDTLGKASSFADDEFMTRKPSSRLRWMPAANVASVKDGRSTQVTPFLADPTNSMDITLVRQLLADKPFEVVHGKSTAAWNTSALVF